MLKSIIAAGLFISLCGFAQEPSDHVYLDKKDLKEIAPVINSYFESYVPQVLQQIVNREYQAVKRAEFVGPINKAQLKIEFADGEEIEFKNVKIQLNKEGRGGYGEYSLIAVCIGADCNKIFATLSVRRDGNFLYNWPMFFKLVDGKYKPAFENSEENGDETEADAKEPAQLTVKNLIEAKRDEHMNSIVEIIRDRMEKRDAAYSGLFFLGMQTPQARFNFEKTAAGLEFSVSAHYSDRYKRKNLDFKGVIDKPEVLRSEATKTNLEVIPFEGTNLIIFLFDQEEYHSVMSPLPELDHGMAAYVCSVVMENETAHHDCRLVETMYVFGTAVVEGKINGPIWLRGIAVSGADLEAIKNEDQQEAFEAEMEEAVRISEEKAAGDRPSNDK